MPAHRCVFISATLLALAAPSAFARKPALIPIDAASNTAFQAEVLAKHNEYRAKHGAPPLKWSDELAKYAKSRADRVVQFEGLSEGHSGLDRRYGENLWWSGSSVKTCASGAQAVTAWYGEIKDYNFKAATFSGKTGHFTQVVWKSTTQIGCARAFLKGSQWYETYVVCTYLPPGNVMGQFPANVLPKK